MRIGVPTKEEKAVTQRLNDLQMEWFVGNEYKIREALVSLNIAVREWQPGDTRQLEFNLG